MSKKPMLLLGLVSPGARSIAQKESGDPPLTHSLVPGLAGGLVGYNLSKEHPVLGFLAGDAIGLNAYRIYRNQGNDRTVAMCNLGVAAAGIVGSLMWKKHPFWGWVAGFAAGSIVTAVVPGSNASKLKKGV